MVRKFCRAAPPVVALACPSVTVAGLMFPRSTRTGRGPTFERGAGHPWRARRFDARDLFPLGEEAPVADDDVVGGLADLRIGQGLRGKLGADPGGIADSERDDGTRG